MKFFLSILFISFFVFCAESKKIQSCVSYEDIVSKIYDLPALANLPDKGESGALFSSYDRASKYNEKTDSYINWDANGDGSGFVRQEGEYSVLADIKGPGVIWRMWSALVGEGKVQIYLDGKLVIDLPWEDYFNGKVAPFNRKGLVYTVAKGLNNYTPIPFQKSCKIVTKAKVGDPRKSDSPVWGKYFQFNYTVFPKGTKVQTFKMKLSREENIALDKASEIMTTNLGKNPLTYRNTKKKTVTWNIPAGKSKTLNITGKQAITALKVQLPKNKNYNDLLRQLTLSINWDNEKSPSVWAPLGDFFGTAPGINEYKSLVMGMTKIRCQSSGVRVQGKEKRGKVSEVRYQDSPPFLKGVRGISTNKDQSTKYKTQSANAFEFYSYWYMPFENKAQITIKNESDKEQQITLIVECSPIKSSFDNIGYFHAKWHRDLEPELKHGIDWEILKTKGKGRFVGFSLHIWNAKGGWWGEGDEKFFVDGEKFPSTIGTGSEDYFGYAWCNPEIFVSAYHSQPTNHNNRGHASNNRWHIGDNIPFQKSFDAYIEKYYKNSRETFYDCVVYWYLSKNGEDKIGEMPLKNRLNYYTGFEMYKEKNALEGENYNNIKAFGGKISTQNMIAFGNNWSGDQQLWWTQNQPGNCLAIIINSPENAEKNLFAQFTKAKDYGIIQLYFNGVKIGDEVDGYGPGITASGKINFGKVKINKGGNLLKIKITGANPKAKKSYMVGLDYIKFE